MPPVYPTRVRTTPSMIPNRDSDPQNQPMAKVAVSVTDGAARSTAGRAARPAPRAGERLKKGSARPAAAAFSRKRRRLMGRCCRRTGQTGFGSDITVMGPLFAGNLIRNVFSINHRHGTAKNKAGSRYRLPGAELTPFAGCSSLSPTFHHRPTGPEPLTGDAP